MTLRTAEYVTRKLGDVLRFIFLIGFREYKYLRSILHQFLLEQSTRLTVVVFAQ
ncbi:MAG: hypothetical protein RL619_2062 [Bacteroidota bacterium]|jgi:hypothetical protein